MKNNLTLILGFILLFILASNVIIKNKQKEKIKINYLIEKLKINQLEKEEIQDSLRNHSALNYKLYEVANSYKSSREAIRRDDVINRLADEIE